MQETQSTQLLLTVLVKSFSSTCKMIFVISDKWWRWAEEQPISFMLSQRSLGSQSLQQDHVSDWKQTPAQFSELESTHTLTLSMSTQIKGSESHASNCQLF